MFIQVHYKFQICDCTDDNSRNFLLVCKQNYQNISAKWHRVARAILTTNKKILKSWTFCRSHLESACKRLYIFPWFDRKAKNNTTVPNMKYFYSRATRGNQQEMKLKSPFSRLQYHFAISLHLLLTSYRVKGHSGL